MERCPRRVYVLGAGFSRAISASMPLTADLGESVVEAISDRLSSAPGPSIEALGFEGWLDKLASAMPHRDQAETLRARSDFELAREGVAGAIAESERQAVSTAIPAWLAWAVRLWHTERAHVITFNYDTLVEAACDTAGLYDADRLMGVPWATITGFQPTGQAGSTWGEVDQDADWSSFHLLKMHGSLNWYARQGDLTGESLLRWHHAGRFGSPREPVPDEAFRWLGGRSRYLVPPSFDKSRYLDSWLLRLNWHRAAEALAEATEVVFIGYSIPEADLAARVLFEENRGSRLGCDYVVVDPTGHDVAARLGKLVGVDPSLIRVVAGEEPALTYVGDRIDELARQAATTLREAASRDAARDRGLMAAAGSNSFAPVVTVRQTPGTAMLTMGEPSEYQGRPAADESSVAWISEGTRVALRELAEVLDRVTRVELQRSDGTSQVVVDWRVRNFRSGPGMRPDYLELVAF